MRALEDEAALDIVQGHPIVYLLWDPLAGLVKIGRTKRMRARWRELEKDIGSPLIWMSYQAALNRDLDYTESESYWLERSLHERFAEHRLVGEWFAPAPAIFEAFGVDPTT